LAAFCWSFTSLFKVLINLICFSFHYFLWEIDFFSSLVIY
jgi:hypothetical protein